MIVVRRWVPLAVSALALTAGCADTPDSADDPSPTETTVEPTSQPASTPASPEVAQSITDLAGSLGVEESAVEVVSVEEVTWRNGSRGCAVPGNMYTQALIDGSRITLRVDGTDYEYHSGGSQPPARCDKPTE